MKLIYKNYILILFASLLISCKTIITNASEYPIITRASELQDLYGISLDSSGTSESCKIFKYIDGTFELDYEYDLIETDEFLPLFYSITIESALSEKEALSNFNLEKNIYSKADKLGGFKHELIDSLNLPGDPYFYAVRIYQGSPNGLIFMSRQGRMIYTLIISGLYSSDHSILEDLILPDIKNLMGFNINKTSEY